MAAVFRMRHFAETNRQVVLRGSLQLFFDAYFGTLADIDLIWVRRRVEEEARNKARAEHYRTLARLNWRQ